MIRHAWSVLCQTPLTDASSNNVSLINVVEQLTLSGPVPRGAVIPFNLHLVSLWVRDPSDPPARGRGRLRTETPAGAGGQIEFDLDLTDQSRLRTFGEIATLTARGTGLYWFIVELQRSPDSAWTEVARLPLQVEATIVEAAATAHPVA
jgi:hypothetical protein